MASILQSLGVTATTAPSPDTYNNQIAEDENLKSARSNCETLKSSLCLAVNVAKLGGMDTTTLQARCDDITALCKSNLTSAQLAQKTKEYAAAAKDSRATTLVDQKTSMTAASTAVSGRLAAAKDAKDITPELLAKYTTLNDQVKAALDTIKAADPLDETTPLPVVTAADEFLIQLDDLENELEELQTKTANTGRWLWNKMRHAMPYITIFLCVLGAIVGGIITSNIFVKEPFWAIKIYYFVYGAAFFPVSLAMGAYNPPNWSAGIIPLFTNTPAPIVSGPTEVIPAAPLPPPPPKSTLSSIGTAAAGIAGAAGLTALASKVSLPQMTLPAGLPKISLPTSLPKITMPKMFGGGPEESGPQPGKSGMFSYGEGQQFMSRNVLRGIAITELICLASVATFYGVDKIAFK